MDMTGKMDYAFYVPFFHSHYTIAIESSGRYEGNRHLIYHPTFQFSGWHLPLQPNLAVNVVGDERAIEAVSIDATRNENCRKALSHVK